MVLIFTGRNEVLVKVMFLQACVILFTGGGCLVPGGFLQFWGGSSNFSGGPPIFRRGVPPIFRGVCYSGTPPGQQTPEYGQRSAGTHPTGMHSCLSVNSVY